MEVADIKRALAEIIPQLEALKSQGGNGDKVRRLMKVFLQQVLGYDPVEEIVSHPLKPCPKQVPVQFDEGVKFMLQVVPPRLTLDQAVAERTVAYALGAKAQLFMLTNGRQLVLYDIDLSSGRLEAEAVFELNLLADDVEQIAINLWPICKKDCGKKVIVNTSDLGKV
jgi:hypothetical protein